MANVEFCSEQKYIDMFVDNLRDILIEKNISQNVLAKKTSTSQSYVSRILSKQIMPSILFANNVSIVLGITIDELTDFGYIVKK